ncbi:MAG TPA: glycosyltransferase family 39 protein, partial [bacterium]|nr:glycosyltransferase family 39 protein [bacterium]
MKPAPPLWGRPAKFLEHSLRPGRRIGWFVLFAALFAAQVVPRIFQDSAYLDEAWETTSGYYYWLRGDAAPPYNHPPLANALQALPLVFLHLKVDPNVWQEGENRAYSLYYVSNPGRLGTILEAPRFLMLGFALAFGFLLYRVVLREKGAVFLAALFLWAFDPTLLSFSIVSKADMPFSFFCFAGLLLFRRGQVERSWKWDALAGALAGAAVTSKMTALCLPVLYGGWDLWEAWKRPAFRGALVRRWAVGSAACAGVVFLVYFPGTLRLADHRWPFAYFLSRVREALGTGGELGTVCGFLGGFYPRAEWWQVPVMFVLKSPLPFLALLALGGTLWARGKVRLPDWAWIFPIGWTALLCV